MNHVRQDQLEVGGWNKTVKEHYPNSKGKPMKIENKPILKRTNSEKKLSKYSDNDLKKFHAKGQLADNALEKAGIAMFDVEMFARKFDKATGSNTHKKAKQLDEAFHVGSSGHSLAYLKVWEEFRDRKFVKDVDIWEVDALLDNDVGLKEAQRNLDTIIKSTTSLPNDEILKLLDKKAASAFRKVQRLAKELKKDFTEAASKAVKNSKKKTMKNATEEEHGYLRAAQAEWKKALKALDQGIAANKKYEKQFRSTHFGDSGFNGFKDSIRLLEADKREVTSEKPLLSDFENSKGKPMKKLLNGVKSECQKVEQDLKKCQEYVLNEFGDQDPTAKDLVNAINKCRRNLAEAQRVANSKEGQKVSQALQKATADLQKIKSQAKGDKKLESLLKDATDNLKEAQRIAKKPLFNSKEKTMKKVRNADLQAGEEEALYKESLKEWQTAVKVSEDAIAALKRSSAQYDRTFMSMSTDGGFGKAMQAIQKELRILKSQKPKLSDYTMNSKEKSNVIQFKATAY